MKSPDGRFEVLKHNYDEVRMGSPLFGQIEIRGSTFGILPGEFAEPLAFSPDSRFLAAAELAGTNPGPAGRVVVFDFQRGVSIIVHSFTGLARGFTWEPDGVLSVTIWNHLAGEDTRRIWSPPPAQPPKQAWWRHLFQSTGRA
jgi:hypothetical protein